nr:hypothetical protein [Acholeplasmatales bacterium]
EYNAYVKETDGTYTKLDSQLIRKYKTEDGNNTYYRVDAVGLAAGTYTIKIAPVFDGTEADTAATEIANLAVVAYDRTGFAFSTASPLAGKTVGAYNLDGTLKSNARVLYITESNKSTVTLDVITNNKGDTQSFTGVGNISQAMSKGYDGRPLVLRLIGKVTQSGLTNNNDSLNLGFKEVYKNLTTAQIADAGITIEGIGNDATLHGAGVRCLKTNNIEIRNLGLMNWPDDGIALESSNINIWVHDCDVFYGAAGSDSDQAKGDGSMDLKDDSGFITISYMHFWDSGKMSLCGMKSESGPNYITYHHNWFDHSDSRHPRIRTMSVHVYNNYFDGNSKYGVGVTTGADAFVENNYFRNCKNPMLSSLTGTDALGNGTFSDETSGTIKAYNNHIEGASSLIYANANTGTQGATTDANASSYDAVLVSSRTDTVDSTYNAGGATYNNFDTSINIGVTADQVETPEDAKATVMKYAGRVQGGDFTWTFDNATEDTNYGVISELKAAVVGYTSRLVSVQGIEGSSSSEDTPTEEVTVDSVIALIDALPEASAITESDRENVNAAKAAYDSLSETDQASVTNYSKLEACIAALPDVTSFTIDYVTTTVTTGSNNVTIYDDNNIVITATKIAAQDDKGIKFNSNKSFTITNNSSSTLNFVLTVIGNDSDKSFTYSGGTVTLGKTATTISFSIAAGGSETVSTSTGGAYLTTVVVSK